jgi:hypothetical protein
MRPLTARCGRYHAESVRSDREAGYLPAWGPLQRRPRLAATRRRSAVGASCESRLCTRPSRERLRSRLRRVRL